MTTQLSTKILSFFILIALLLSACSAANNPAPVYSGEYETAPEEAKPSGGAGADYSNTIPVERMVIKNASLTIAVNSPEDTMNRISALASEMDGYVVTANLYRRTLSNGVEVPEAGIMIRVPAERLDEALDRVRAETSVPVLEQNIESKDVTNEYVDLESRLRNLEATEAQLQEIMDQADETEDVLSVYSQLVSVREQIEVIKGQMQYIEQSSAMSSISVKLETNEAVQPIKIGPWSPVGEAKEAVQALISVVQFFARAGIWLVIVGIPVLVFLSAPFVALFFIIRRFTRRPNRQQAPPPAPVR